VDRDYNQVLRVQQFIMRPAAEEEVGMREPDLVAAELAEMVLKMHPEEMRLQIQALEAAEEEVGMREPDLVAAELAEMVLKMHPEEMRLQIQALEAAAADMEITVVPAVQELLL
jgi:hypothetical protein